MEIHDFTTWAGIAGGVALMIEVLKTLIPAMKGREPHVAIVLVVLIAATTKSAGAGFSDVAWPHMVFQAILIAAAPGVLHDKVLNPLNPDPEKRAR